MAYRYLNNMELDEALASFLDIVRQRGWQPREEEIPVTRSFGRITSRAVFAVISSPHYNACAMDGIALSAKSTFGATETTPVRLVEGRDFVRVDTGDPLPPEYDAVVMIEDVIETGDGTIRLIGAAVPWQHIRQIGEDICAGEMLLPSNTRIEPAAIGALMAGGVLKVKVYTRPVVGLIPTGDEIVAPTDHPAQGEIIEFNSSIFSAMLTQWGAEPKTYGIVPDRFERIKEAVIRAAEECDLVVINAGSSAGREDYSEKAIGEAGEVFTHGLAIKPGKPTILGVIKGKPAVGVPGYPVSGILVMEHIVRPLLDSLLCRKPEEIPQVTAQLARKLVSSLKYREFVRVKLGYVGEKLIATPLSRGAGVVTSFVKADGILEIPMNLEGLEAGQPVKIGLLRPEGEIRNSLVVTGSHDPLIDLAGDWMRKNHKGEFISSSHVGSMAGIMAVKRGEAHLAGIHLLEEDTGKYNRGYIHRYLGDRKVKLIKCVGRTQGLMVAPGNPAGICGLEDLRREGIRYVNRQKGSGTRILLDYLLRCKNMRQDDIYGYQREEFTHMSVAALVASGSADAGLGIFSAARAYGLDFIPVCQETYDFVVPENFMELPLVQHFIGILRSEEFKLDLEKLGGYDCSCLGSVENV